MVNIIGTPGDDSFENSLLGTNEADILIGLAGNDFLVGSFGSDILIGGTGIDVLIYDGLTIGLRVNTNTFDIDGIAAGTVEKIGVGIDTVDGFEAVHLSQADDVAYIGQTSAPGHATYTFDKAGDDYVEVASRPDSEGHIFYAGSGHDIFVGTDAPDRIDYYASNEFDDGGLQTQGIVVTFDGVGSGEIVDAWGFIDTFTSVENFNGTDFDDQIKGSQGGEIFNTFGGDDKIFARGGDDVINGGDGEDTIDGGNGNNYIEGGADSDIFVIASNSSGYTVIGDFEDGIDRIDLRDFGLGDNANQLIKGAASKLSATAVEIDLAALGGDGLLLVEGLGPRDMDGADFIL